MLMIPRRATRSTRGPGSAGPALQEAVSGSWRFSDCFYSCFSSPRYLRSLVETILIYQQFHKPGPEQPAPKQELVDFWMDFLVEATKSDVSSVRFPVSELQNTGGGIKKPRFEE